MAIEKADVVRSLAGRDAGELFFVSSTDGEYAQIVNGRDRRTDRPKRKKLKHLELVERGSGRVEMKLRIGEKVTNSELRRALAGKAGAEAEGGMQNGEG